jgi:hypothetical protein
MFLEEDIKFRASAPPPSVALITTDYRSHYNTRLNRCLVVLTQTLSFPIYGRSQIEIKMIDANERLVYARWTGRTQPKEVLFTQEHCGLYRERRSCASQDEFHAFIAPYMEE